MIFIIKEPKDFKLVCDHFKKFFFINQKRSLIFFLTGSFGVGKTTFVKYLASSLLIDDKITSSSFNFYSLYKLKDNNFFIHADFYKLNENNQHLVSEIFEYYLLETNNIIIIEWADRFKKYSDFIKNAGIKVFLDFQDKDPKSSTRLLEVQNY